MSQLIPQLTILSLVDNPSLKANQVMKAALGWLWQIMKIIQFSTN